jgi:long-subunit acyl-CoA synthetase (AMP-forming)
MRCDILVFKVCFFRTVNLYRYTVGLLLVRGPGVMAGYLDDAGATARTVDAEGWLDTGDLGWVAPAGVAGSNMAGNVVLVGRMKDTIVLSSGRVGHHHFSPRYFVAVKTRFN